MATKPKTALMVQVEQSELETETASSLINTFNPLFAQAEEWTAQAKGIVVTDINDKEGMLRARELRLKLQKVRTTTENTRKRLKEDSLRKGKAIDGIANVIKFLIEPIEEHLERQEKFAEIQEAARIATLTAERTAKLAEFGADPSQYPPLGELTEEVFGKIVSMLTFEKQQKEEAARRAEEERIASEKAAAEERVRIQQENERLRKEAEAREEELRIEREKAAAAQAEADAAARKAREEAEAAAAKARAEAEAEARKIREEAEAKAREEQAKLDEERRKREALEAELAEQRRKEEEEARRAEEEKRQAVAAAAPEVSLKMDGNMWCFLWGSDLQEGIAGFGETPEAAMDDFITNWHAEDKKTLV